MALDFDKLLLSPLQDVFGDEVLIDPVISQPGAEPYKARGSYISTAYDVTLQDGSIFSDQKTELFIRLSEFSVPPENRDRVFVAKANGSPVNVWFLVGDTDTDGSGEMSLLLRKETAL